ncbi:MAG TPA: hypothetical protein VG412_13665 [Acidimicrobiales bacterium]|nr:hypothetical protein [Acidimicrobiales bacterium]
MSARTGPHPLRVRARYTGRRALDRIDNETVRRARGLLRRLRSDAPDVIYLGDSALSIVGSNDSDRRRLDAMVADLLGDGVSVKGVDGASYHAELFDALLRLVEATPHRPLLLVPLCVRVRTPQLTEHPIYAHKQAVEFLRRVDLSGGAWRVHAAWPRPSGSDFDAYYRVPHPTLLGNWTVGDYLASMSESQRAGDEDARIKTLYAFFHGGLLEPGSPELESVTRMGSTIRALGCQAVVYQTPVPVETGVASLGQALADRTAANFAMLNAAYRLGAGEDAEIVESGTCFSASEFIDPTDATEHLNDIGRLRLAEMVVASIKRRRASG